MVSFQAELISVQNYETRKNKNEKNTRSSNFKFSRAWNCSTFKSIILLKDHSSHYLHHRLLFQFNSHFSRLQKKITKYDSSYLIHGIQFDSWHIGKRGYHTWMTGTGCVMKSCRTGTVGCISVQRFHCLSKVVDDANVVASSSTH